MKPRSRCYPAAIARALRRLALATLIVWTVVPAVGGVEPTPAHPGLVIQATAVVLPPAPKLLAIASGDSITIQADLSPTVTTFFSLVPVGDGRWTIVLSIHDGKALAAYQYPLAIGSLAPSTSTPPAGLTPPGFTSPPAAACTGNRCSTPILWRRRGR